MTSQKLGMIGGVSTPNRCEWQRKRLKRSLKASPDAATVKASNNIQHTYTPCDDTTNKTRCSPLTESGYNRAMRQVKTHRTHPRHCQALRLSRALRAKTSPPRPPQWSARGRPSFPPTDSRPTSTPYGGCNSVHATTKEC